LSCVIAGYYTCRPCLAPDQQATISDRISDQQRGASEGVDPTSSSSIVARSHVRTLGPVFRQDRLRVAPQLRAWEDFPLLVTGPKLSESAFDKLKGASLTLFRLEVAVVDLARATLGAPAAGRATSGPAENALAGGALSSRSRRPSRFDR
jgi:hypothetical protein